MSSIESSSPRRGRGWRWVWIGLGSVVVLGVVGAITIKWAIGRYIESESFRTLAGQNAGGPLHAKVDFDAFHLDGSELLSEGVRAEGKPGAAFTDARVNSIRANWTMKRLLDRVCQLESVELGHATLRLGAPVAVEAAVPAKTAPERGKESAGGGLLSGLLPNRVAIGSVSLEQGEVTWPDGKAEKITMQAKSSEGEVSGKPEWKVEGTGGPVTNAGWPALDLKSFALRYRGERLYVENMELRQGGAGVLTVEGTVDSADDFDLNVKGERLSAEIVMPPDWRQHLRGTLSGEANLTPSRLSAAPVALRGTWKLNDARLEALPILDQLALFTQTAQFRRIPLSKMTGKFSQRGDALDLTEIVAESPGLASLQGTLKVHGEQLDGTFELGVAPALFQWLPVTRTKVFATNRNGYAWTSFHVGGTTSHPTEDLTSRLAVDVANQVIDTATGTAGQVKEKATEAAKGVLDMFFGR